MELIVYDCLLLSDMAYVGEVELIKSTLKGRGHRFSNILVSDDLDHDKQGHYVIADVESGLENKTTYLAIRGSFIPSDWAANASFWPSFQDMGIVHAGWYSRMSHLPWSFLRDRLLDGHNVVITGHSLGGAVAQLLTMKLLDSMNLNSNKTEMWEKVQCVTFGAPVVANGVLADRMNQETMKPRFWHFIHSEDVVPKILTWTQNVLGALTDSCVSVSTVLNIVQLCVGRGHSTLQGTTECLSEDSITTDLKKSPAAAKFVDGACLKSDLFTYKPIGTYFLVNSDNQYVPLSPDEVRSKFDVSQAFRLATRAWDAHHIQNSYGHSLKFSANASSLYRFEEPNLMTADKPEVTEIKVLPGSISNDLLKVSGKNLSGVKDFIVTKCDDRLQMSGFDSRQEGYSIQYVNSQEVFISYPRIHYKEQTDFIAPSSVCDVRTTSFFAWKDATDHTNVRLSCRTSPMDQNSLQSLLYYGCHVLTLTRNDTELSNHPDYRDLKKIVAEIFDTIPFEVAFVYGSAIADKWLRDDYTETIKKLHISQAGIKVLQEYIKNAKLQVKGTPDEKQIPPHVLRVSQHQISLLDSMRNPTELAQCTFSTISILDMASGRTGRGTDEERERDMYSLLNTLSGDFIEARDMTTPDKDKESYDRFISKLLAGIAVPLSFFFLPVGSYFNPSQDSHGPADESISTFLKSTGLQQIIVPLSQSVLGVSVGAFALGAILLASANPWGALLMYGGFVSSAVNGLALEACSGWPTSVLKSSSRLRDELVYPLFGQLAYPQWACNGDKDAAIADRLEKYNLRYDSHWKDYRKLLQRLFPARDVFATVVKRVKLIVLTSKLREVAKRLPIVLVRGSTKSGKSALREHLRPNPDHDKYGGKNQHRTSVPEIFRCNVEGLDGVFRTVCLMDTIGIGDTTNTEIKDTIDKANSIFKDLSAASVIVCEFDKMSSCGVAYATSSVQRTAAVDDEEFPKIPTMTCITKSDRHFDEDDGYDCPKFRKTLEEEIPSSLARGLPVDMVPVESNPYYPRVWAAFLRPDREAKMHPSIRGNFILTAKEVGYWMASVLYG